MRGMKVGAWEGASWQGTVRGTSMAQDRVQGGEGVWGVTRSLGGHKSLGQKSGIGRRQLDMGLLWDIGLGGDMSQLEGAGALEGT